MNDRELVDFIFAQRIRMIPPRAVGRHAGTWTVISEGSSRVAQDENLRRALGKLGAGSYSSAPRTEAGAELAEFLLLL